MATIFFTSDLHDGHRAIPKYRGSFVPSIVDVESNREFIRDNWRATKRDTVILLGDIFFAKDSHEFIKTLPGNKTTLLGNHDVESNGRSKIEDILTCSKIAGVVKRKVVIDGVPRKIWLQHTPMHPSELRGCLMGHGHIHDEQKDYQNRGTELFDQRYMNFNIDAIYKRTGKIMLSTSEISDYYNGNYDKIRKNNLLLR